MIRTCRNFLIKAAWRLAKIIYIKQLYCNRSDYSNIAIGRLSSNITVAILPDTKMNCTQMIGTKISGIKMKGYSFKMTGHQKGFLQNVDPKWILPRPFAFCYATCVLGIIPRVCSLCAKHTRKSYRSFGNLAVQLSDTTNCSKTYEDIEEECLAVRYIHINYCEKL